MDEILRPDRPGRIFFDLWRQKRLQGTLGYPRNPKIGNVDRDTIELTFQYGVLQVRKAPDMPVCYRILTSDEAKQRDYALRCVRDGARWWRSSMPRSRH